MKIITSRLFPLISETDTVIGSSSSESTSTHTDPAEGPLEWYDGESEAFSSSWPSIAASGCVSDDADAMVLHEDHGCGETMVAVVLELVVVLLVVLVMMFFALSHVGQA